MSGTLAYDLSIAHKAKLEQFKKTVENSNNHVWFKDCNQVFSYGLRNNFCFTNPAEHDMLRKRLSQPRSTGKETSTGPSRAAPSQSCISRTHKSSGTVSMWPSRRKYWGPCRRRRPGLSRWRTRPVLRDQSCGHSRPRSPPPVVSVFLTPLRSKRSTGASSPTSISFSPIIWDYP